MCYHVYFAVGRSLKLTSKGTLTRTWWTTVVVSLTRRFPQGHSQLLPRVRPYGRLRQGLFEGACSDLKRALAAGDPKDDEARALLKEAEAGAALSSCCDPEAKARGERNACHPTCE